MAIPTPTPRCRTPTPGHRAPPQRRRRAGRQWLSPHRATAAGQRTTAELLRPRAQTGRAPAPRTQAWPSGRALASRGRGGA
eukprot:6677298-Alexandrium_andersonii.AAC.1